MSEIRTAAPLSLRLAKFAVLGAVFTAACYAVELGVSRSPSPLLIPAVVMGYIAVVLMEILAWHNAALSWHKRQGGSLVAWIILGIVMSCGTLYTNFATSAINQEAKSSIQQTSFNTYADLSSSEAELKREIAALDQKLALAPTETAEAYDAKIEDIKRHKWWNATDECRAPKGPSTRKFCSDYASAIANKENATASLTWTAERKAAADKLDHVRGKRSTTQAVVSEDSPAIVFLAKTVTEGDKDAARQLDSMSLPLFVQAIMLLGGILLANEHSRDIVKRPWINWRRIGYSLNWITCCLAAKPLPKWEDFSQTINHVEIVDPSGSIARRELQDFRNHLSPAARAAHARLDAIVQRRATSISAEPKGVFA